ncbi:hypothetical protein Pcinc_026945 [Petrolisthes cinctipes]|uniref:Uncharacterized protein n=1 Tax=Petrolisthes cinctipes TaxID=88211 RepID=A0AAE1F606_PETCI|nr:hypothetical protein Pcinc_026945 [Petrolisthes cinctipes]
MATVMTGRVFVFLLLANTIFLSDITNSSPLLQTLKRQTRSTDACLTHNLSNMSGYTDTCHTTYERIDIDGVSLYNATCNDTFSTKQGTPCSAYIQNLGNYNISLFCYPEGLATNNGN